MPGIYIHIPFCRQACHYCDFHFSTSLKSKDDLLKALHKEIGLQADFFGGREDVGTVYFGGGTPSLLSTEEIVQILAHIHEYFPVERNAEITLEANPDDLGIGKLESLRDAGINRLSIGIQSFDHADLKWMNRLHSASQAVGSVKRAQEAGFDNITIDLI